MKVLTVSDEIVEPFYSPNVEAVAGGVDLILSCGDLPSAYLEYLSMHLRAPLYYVMGNHGGMGGEKGRPEGCEDLDGRVVEHNGLLIAGLEGSKRYNNRPQYQYTESEMRHKIARLAPRLWLNRLRYGRYPDILITHAPPFRIHDGRDAAHEGFRSLLWFIDHYHPRYLIHGHQHIYDNRAIRETRRGSTLVLNAFRYKILELDRVPESGDLY